MNLFIREGTQNEKKRLRDTAFVVQCIDISASAVVCNNHVEVISHCSAWELIQDIKSRMQHLCTKS